MSDIGLLKELFFRLQILPVNSSAKASRPQWKDSRGNRQGDITWNNIEYHNRRHIASQGHNVLDEQILKKITLFL